MRSGFARVALVTGGAGFIGTNLAERLLAEPNVQVRIFDNYSRRGVKHNIEHLLSLDRHHSLDVIEGDVRDLESVSCAVKGATEIYHLAAQVAVTTSILDPATDFATNALGTLNVLEAARSSSTKPFLLYTSTNKVYGSLHRVPVEAAAGRYRVVKNNFYGVDENEALDFHSPYGCSKGAADQYVRDYARIYEMPTVVLRMSCIAGPRQFGNEDQGWVAHFIYSVLSGHPITIYGDGCQVRDVLHVDDLVEAILAARLSVGRTHGEIYNIGGGVDRVSSVIEMLGRIERHIGRSPIIEHSNVRPGDQPLYVSDTAKFRRHTGWKPSRSIDEILRDIGAFWEKNENGFLRNVVESQLITEEVA